MPFKEGLRDLVIRTIIGEAAGEGPEGWRAVAHVIRNRYEKGGYGNGLVQILRPDQFNANANPMKLDPSDPTYQRVGVLVDNVFDGDSVDPTGGATHYYNPATSNPKWGPGMADRKQIGNHTFGKADIKLGEHGLDPRTQNALEWIQARAKEEGIPLRVTSTRRSEDENRRVGGDRNSQHLIGRGFDLGYRDLTPAQQARVEEIALRAPGVNGLKGEGDHLHVDTREGYRYVGGNFQPSVQASLAAFRQGYPLEPIQTAAAAPAAASVEPLGITAAGLPIPKGASGDVSGGAQGSAAAAPGVNPVTLANATPAAGSVTTTADIPATGSAPAASTPSIMTLPPPPPELTAAPAPTPEPAPATLPDVTVPAPPPVEPYQTRRGRAYRPPQESMFAPPAAPPADLSRPWSGRILPTQPAPAYADDTAPKSLPLAPPAAQGLDPQGSRPMPNIPKPPPLDPLDRPSLPKPPPADPFDRPGDPLGALPSRADLPLAPKLAPLDLPLERPDTLAPPSASVPLTKPTELMPLAPQALTRRSEPAVTGSTGGGQGSPPPSPPARPPEFGGPPVGGPALGLAGGPDADWQTMMGIARGGPGAMPPPPPYLSAQAPQNPFGLLFQRLFGMG